MKIGAVFVVALTIVAISRWFRIPSLAPQAIVGHRDFNGDQATTFNQAISTQGHIGDVLPDKIIYDAQTTSGGPLFNDQGQVTGINFAMVRDFGGSNFAIPVRFGESVVKP